MKRGLLFSLAIIIVALGSLLLFSCGDLPEDSVKTVASISVSPSSASVEVGATKTFTAYAVYTDATTGAISPTWSVTATIGSLAKVGYSGLFTASAEGTGTITATYEGKSASASITVTAEAGTLLATIEISPSNATLRVSDSQVFTAAGESSSGESMSINPSWAMTGDAIGTLTSNGVTTTLEAVAEGTARISCTSSEITVYAYVTVEGFVTEITVETDTYVDEANPSVTHGTDTSLKAGYVNATGKEFQTYLKFSLSSLPPGASVEAATIKVYPSSAGSSSLQVKKLDSSFDNNTTWESRPTQGSYLMAGSFTSGIYNNLTSTALNDLVAAWHTGATINNGLAIVQEGSEDGTVVILSKENGDNPPVLRIEYSQ
ncbi:MAG: DNRLRE domain-containing protein [Candidatus Margulisbacteria bacterium]|nr:DNRLRE domain-containing protein [Candidatus Margulisiibacteriota bacterium]